MGTSADNVLLIVCAQPIHVATINGKADCLRLLLQYGAKPDTLDHTHYSALHLAAYTGQLEAWRGLRAGLASWRQLLFKTDAFIDESHAFSVREGATGCGRQRSG